MPYPKRNADDGGRYQPRTFAYSEQLPFAVEGKAQRDDVLQEILKQLYIAIRAKDFSSALHRTIELRGWLGLKFEMAREQRAKLVKLYYSLALAPGLGSDAADEFLRMVLTLTRKDHYLKPGKDLTLNWRPLWNDIKAWVLPLEVPMSNRKRSAKQLLRLCANAHTYFDPTERRAMLEEFLPFFSADKPQNAFIVVGVLNALLPSHPAPISEPQSQPGDFFPTLFHLWSIVNRSEAFDISFIDVLSRMARDHIHCSHVPFGSHGIFTKDQSDLIFTAILRLTRIPVRQGSSPYTPLGEDVGAGKYIRKDKKKYP
ncbi:proteasome activator subunit 4, partial [Fusarium albosuccineum]